MMHIGKNAPSIKSQLQHALQPGSVDGAGNGLRLMAAVMCLSLTSLAGHADDEWQAIGTTAKEQSATTSSYDAWTDISSAKPTDDGWVEAGTENPGNLPVALVPTLPSIDLPADKSSALESEVALVEPSIIEFGEDGSAADLVITTPDTIIYEQVVDQTNLDMFAGELKVLGKVDVTRVAIGNGGIIRAEILDTGELLIIAQAAGSTSLRLWNKDETQSSYNIRVSETDTETRVRMERMVRMRVRMVEFRKSALGQLGIDWGSSANGPTFAAAGDAIGNNLFRPVTEGFDGLPNRVRPFSTYFGIASDITSRINFLAQKGDAITLAEPVLSAMNGGSASFLAGGEVPFPTTSDTGQPVVDFKEYGIKLDVAPMIDSAGSVRTLVKTEISQLDSAVAINGVPGLLTRRAQTEFNVQTGETIVISGLLNAESSNDVNFIPGIGRLPVIGKLFSSKNQRNAVTELVIFVTPEVIEPGQQFNTARENERYDETSERLRQARKQLPIME